MHSLKSALYCRRGFRVVLAVLEHQLNFHDYLSQSINRTAKIYFVLFFVSFKL